MVATNVGDARNLGELGAENLNGDADHGFGQERNTKSLHVWRPNLTAQR